MGNTESSMALYEVRSATHNLARFNGLATMTAKGLRNLIRRIEDDEHCVRQLEEAVVQRFRYMDAKAADMENRHSHLEAGVGHLQLQLAVVTIMIIALLLCCFPNVLASATAVCKQALGLSTTAPQAPPASPAVAPTSSSAAPHYNSSAEE